MENVHLSNDLSPTIMVMNALGANSFFLKTIYPNWQEWGSMLYFNSFNLEPYVEMK